MVSRPGRWPDAGLCPPRQPRRCSSPSALRPAHRSRQQRGARDRGRASGGCLHPPPAQVRPCQLPHDRCRAAGGYQTKRGKRWHPADRPAMCGSAERSTAASWKQVRAHQRRAMEPSGYIDRSEVPAIYHCQLSKLYKGGIEMPEIGLDLGLRLDHDRGPAAPWTAQCQAIHRRPRSATRSGNKRTVEPTTSSNLGWPILSCFSPPRAIRRSTTKLLRSRMD